MKYKVWFQMRRGGPWHRITRSFTLSDAHVAAVERALNPLVCNIVVLPYGDAPTKDKL